jgi:hypothetical protein
MSTDANEERAPGLVPSTASGQIASAMAPSVVSVFQLYFDKNWFCLKLSGLKNLFVCDKDEQNI